MRTRTILTIAGAVVAVTTLAGCSGTDSTSGMDHGSTSTPDTASPTAEDGTFNDQDIAFAQMMTAHHEQAIEMADTLLSKTGVDEQVVQTASNIKAAQQPEIDTMADWLKSWGASTNSMTGMDHGGSGMMSDADMNALAQANGTDASRMFLEQMIEHHQGAVAMAQTEVDAGQNTDAVALAQKIINDQTAEIAEMQKQLSELP